MLSVLVRNIFLVIGFRNFEFAYPPYMNKFLWRKSDAKLIVESSHNEYLQLVMEIGWWGAIIFIIILGLLIKMVVDLILKKAKNRGDLAILLGLLGGIIATIIHAAFSSNFQKPASLVQFWFLAGIVGIYYRENSQIVNKVFFIEKISKIVFISSGIFIFILVCWFSMYRFKADKFLKKGYLYASAKNWPEAVKNYQRSINYNPYKYKAYFLCGDAFIMLGLPYKKDYYSRAIDYYEKAKRLNPYYPNIYYNMAAVRLNLGGYYTAIKHYKKALEEYNSAIDYYKDALKVNPVYEMALEDMGYLCIELRKYKEAAAAYKRAVEIKSDNLSFNKNLGRIYLKLGDKAEKMANRERKFKAAENCIKIFKKCLKLSPDSPEAYTELGDAYVMGKDLDKAKEAYEKAIELNSDYAPAYNNLGYNIYIKKGTDNTKAIELINKALNLSPNTAVFWDSLGWAHYNSNKMKEAKRYIVRAIKLGPRRAIFYKHLGEVYLSTGKREMAMKIWEKSLQLDPDNKVLRSRLFIIRKIGKEGKDINKIQMPFLKL
jgi:tetratricopeptide (TPR) repeat protein/uncharacterized membrane protein YeaQ/YmgE (transglycosylase-associated protein family)